MLLQTKVEIRKASFEITPTDRLLFVGSCFADNIGKRFADNKFRAVTNPYGVMYNPASVMHTIDKVNENFDVAVLTLGTNHVYILKETGEIVDNCMKRPQRLFDERELTVDECEAYLRKAVQKLRERNADVKVVITVSPIRYAKYGYHGSRLSKATLLLAAEKMVKDGEVEYFPAYEIMNDELRDYRFYEPDMLHPSAQAVDYIYERFKELFFSKDATQMEKEWQPISQALKHRPFNPDSEEYRAFLEKAKNDEQRFIEKWRL
ncbi:MAG: GSCFA domain-containing protein [Prevotella sp.]|nr:GSCFA domain-containing protein [Prevotella sp.]